MLHSINNYDDGAELTADVCIVGAGAVGISLALRLAGRGLKVAALVGGGREESKADQALYAGEVVDAALHTPLDQYRHRVLGGSTTTWGGRCVRFDPIDFEQRDWVADSGWPIGPEDVEPYYRDALAFAEAGDDDYDPATATAGGMRPIVAGWTSELFDQGNLERFSCPTDFGRRWATQLSEAPDLDVLFDAHVTEIVTNPQGGRVEALQVRSLAGKSFRFVAKTFILACGGIETPRLMLASRRFDPRGVGNAHDLVGRYYMCHIAGTSGEVEFAAAAAPIFNQYERSWDGVYVRRRIHLRPEAQRRLKTGNIVLRLHHPRLPDPRHGRGILSLIYMAKPFIGYEYAKRLASDNKMTLAMWGHHVFNVLRDNIGVATFLFDWFRKRTLAARKFPSLVVQPRNRTYAIEVHAEQAPNRDSRIMLSEEKDAFGMPRVKVDWRWAPLDIETVRVTLQALGEDLAAKGLGRVTFDAGGVEQDMLRDGAFGGHHVGATRMSDDPAKGVVDRNCRVHGVDNLYVAGSAVFATSSQANPTLLAIALALRLADRIAGEKTAPRERKSALQEHA